MIDHSSHGRSHLADIPDDPPDCPCRATPFQYECAASNCGICLAAEPYVPKEPGVGSPEIDAAFQKAILGVRSDVTTGELAKLKDRLETAKRVIEMLIAGIDRHEKDDNLHVMLYVARKHARAFLVENK